VLLGLLSRIQLHLADFSAMALVCGDIGVHVSPL
jgi:hypothetical protein